MDFQHHCYWKFPITVQSGFDCLKYTLDAAETCYPSETTPTLSVFGRFRCIRYSNDLTDNRQGKELRVGIFFY